MAHAGRFPRAAVLEIDLGAFGVEDGGVQAGDFGEVFEGLEGAFFFAVFDDGGGLGGLQIEGFGDGGGGGLVDVDTEGGELGDEIVGDFGPFLFLAFGAAPDHVLDDVVPAVAGVAAADEVSEAVAGSAEALGGGAAGAFGELRLGRVGGEEVRGEEN